MAADADADAFAGAGTDAGAAVGAESRAARSGRSDMIQPNPESWYRTSSGTIRRTARSEGPLKRAAMVVLPVLALALALALPVLVLMLVLLVVLVLLLASLYPFGWRLLQSVILLRVPVLVRILVLVLVLVLVLAVSHAHRPSCPGE